MGKCIFVKKYIDITVQLKTEKYIYVIPKSQQKK